jgi:hypothetical protein
MSEWQRSRFRALVRWTAACQGESNQAQYKEIARTMGENCPPILKFLSYNLQDIERGDIYSVVERTLQTAFGIQMVWEKIPGGHRLVQRKGSLVQKRNDSKNHPVLSVEAAVCKALNKSGNEIDPADIACDQPVLLVGLSKTYSPAYSQVELAEMARMWWNLSKLGNRFQELKKYEYAILVAWSSEFGKPQIVGLWQIVKGSFVASSTRPGRLKCDVVKDYALQRKWLGTCLVGSGQSYFGPRIYLPD